MISGQPGQRPDLLHQYELGGVPYEIGREQAADHEGRPGKKRRKRRWWDRFLRRR